MIPFEKSFASHSKANCWSEQNTINPENVKKCSNKKFWFNCDKCSHLFLKSLDNITKKNSWCPYCSGRKLCDANDCKQCWDKSFASHEKSFYWSSKNQGSPRNVFKNGHQKGWFDCNICHHSFLSTIYNVSCGNTWCPYCSNAKLCDNPDCLECFERSFASHEKAKNWSSTNNEIPRQVAKNSHLKYNFDCEICCQTFTTRPNTITNKLSWCPFCKRKTERKLLIYLQDRYITKTQKYFTWTKTKYNQYLKYDFYIPSLRLVIELDGAQHFQQVSNWRSPQETKQVDQVKNNLALQHGYHVLRICQQTVLFDKDNWIKQFENVINNLPQTPFMITIGKVYQNA